MWRLVAGLALGATFLASAVATAEQAGAPASGGRRLAGRIDAGDYHTCAIVDDNTVRCWGYGHLGRLGYGNVITIGDTETPRAMGPVILGGLVQ
jgi:hypothetical protein